jgi:hypothetical protein
MTAEILSVRLILTYCTFISSFSVETAECKSFVQWFDHSAFALSFYTQLLHSLITPSYIALSYCTQLLRSAIAPNHSVIACTQSLLCTQPLLPLSRCLHLAVACTQSLLALSRCLHSVIALSHCIVSLRWRCVESLQRRMLKSTEKSEMKNKWK